jgi:hypothetical protein
VYDSYTEERANKEIRSFVCKKLIVADNRFFSVLSDAIYRSSDGWLPINESEFFSERAVNQICQRIGIGEGLAALALPHHRAYGSVHGGSHRLSQCCVMIEKA